MVLWGCVGGVLLLVLARLGGCTDQAATEEPETGVEASTPVNCEGESVFYCPSEHLCIPLAWTCDGTVDCHPGGEDEEDCGEGPKLPSRADFFSRSSRPPLKACLPHEFKCQDYNHTHVHCIPRSQLCDGNRDCSEGSDEGGLCGSCSHFGCTGRCEENPILGPSCSCGSGEMLGSDGKVCLDMDECLLHHHPCNHICHNLVPHFKCLCAPGFELASDGRSCHLPKDSEPASLFLSHSHLVSELLLTSPSHTDAPLERELALTSRAHAIPGLDFAPSLESVVMAASTSAHSGAIHRFHKYERKEEALITNVRGLGNLAVDWVARLLYYTASDSGRADAPASIGACTLDGRWCTRLNLSLPELHRPRGLVVHPARGLLFWSDWGKAGPKIEAAGLDGSGREADLVVGKLEWPNALAMDYAGEKLYWADAQFRLIERLDLVSGRREIVVSQDVHHPYDLAIFDNRLYWSDWAISGIMAAQLDAQGKVEGRPWSLAVPLDDELVYGLAIAHPAYHASDLHNPCAVGRHNCSHICALTPAQSMRAVEGATGLNLGAVKAACLCPSGYAMDPDEPLKGCLPHSLFPSASSSDALPAPDSADSDELLPRASRWRLEPRLAEGRLAAMCEAGTACFNGGTCLEKGEREATDDGAYCDCPFPFAGRFCEVNLLAWPDHEALSIRGASHGWIAALILIGLVLVIMGALTGYYSRKWTPKRVREEKMLPRLPSVTFFRSMTASSLSNLAAGNRVPGVSRQGSEEERQRLHSNTSMGELPNPLEPSHSSPSLHKASIPNSGSFANPLYVSPSGESVEKGMEQVNLGSTNEGLVMKTPLTPGAKRSTGSGDDSGFETALDSGEHTIVIA